MKFGSSRDLVEEESCGEVRLAVQDGDEAIVCRVSGDALQALAGAQDPRDLLRIAYDHYELLTDKWAQRIQLGVCELDGSVLLRRGDVAAKQRPGDDSPAAGRRRAFLPTE